MFKEIMQIYACILLYFLLKAARSDVSNKLLQQTFKYQKASWMDK